jgi:CHAT domain-containing protein/tetratricopeptide (TPR) repeat protein
MRRILAWVALGAFGILLATAAPPRVPAQQAPPVPAEVEPGLLGASLRVLMPQSVKALGLAQEHAVLVELPSSGGPADQAGIHPGDVIVEFEGAAAGSPDFIAAIQRSGAGTTITLRLLRGGNFVTVRTTLAKAADIPEDANADERRIEALEVILAIFNRETFPLEWARTQYNLGNAYKERVRGVPTDNLEKAIAAFEQALGVQTHEASPRARATTQVALGMAYWGRIRGDPADNLERAIAAFDEALTVGTRENVPREWARTQNILGLAYMARVRGDRADNLEKAIAAYQQTLAVWIREALPREWARTQNHLGDAYRNRIRGDRADNLEQAIAAFEQALTIGTRESSPDWAATQHKLGNAYRDRMRGDRADNLEKAIAAYGQALTVRTRESTPQDWATSLNNLANAYQDRIRGDRADNLERAIATFERTLTVFTREAFPEDWAATQNNLGMAYWNRIRGDRADNVEKAIAVFEQALTVRTQQAFPQDWAATQQNLGAAYWSRIKGDHADNLEKAIAAFEQALTVRTREASPGDWAMTLNNLGAAYWNRIRGDRADNMEKAIAAFEQALAVRTREALPQDWATTQNNLGLVYKSRVRGDRADNLEKAIAAFEQALTVSAHQALPLEWAAMQNNLGNAYQERVRGDRADNLEKAISAYEQALTVSTREASPRDWAITQHNLGTAYSDRIRGDRADNLDRAIDAFSRALTIYTRETLPRDWAATLNNLGTAYQERIRGDRSDNVEKAIAAYEQALTAISRDAWPLEWAAAQNNLGIAYANRILGDRADNREKAIAALEQALTVRTREALPQDWAATQHNLGIVHAGRIRGERARNLERAIAAYEQALTVRTRETLPRDHLTTAHRLGSVYLSAQKWREAGAALDSAREAFLLLFGQGLNEAEAVGLIRDAGPLFADAAFAAAQLGDTERALALANEGRARLMAVALKLQTLDLPADKRRRLDELRAEIRDADRTVEGTQGTQRAAAVERLASLRNELAGLVRDADAAEERRRGSALTQARALAGTDGAVVVPIVTAAGSKILIVTQESAKTGAGGAASQRVPVMIDLPDLTTATVAALMGGGSATDGTARGWLGAYRINHIDDKDVRNFLWSEWEAAIADLGPQLWDLFGARLDAALKEAGIGPGARMVWLPTDAIGILPLGIAQNPATKRRLTDDYEIVYAPSLQTLTAAREHIAGIAGQAATLAAVVNPTRDIPNRSLPATEQEGELIASYFPAPERTVLAGSGATHDAVLAALRGRSHWHFATHGTFKPDNVRESGIYLSGPGPDGRPAERRLTLEQLQQAQGLGRPRLVVLSACETGLYDINRTPDEFIGLPGAFTALGADGVLGTLWPVSDRATALLMARFYELHVGEGLSPPAALRRAQLWLRESTNADLVVYARAAAMQGRLAGDHAADIERDLSAAGLARSRRSALVEWVTPEATRGPGNGGGPAGATGRLAHPYAHPYYWAGFIYTGL